MDDLERGSRELNVQPLLLEVCMAGGHNGHCVQWTFLLGVSACIYAVLPDYTVPEKLLAAFPACPISYRSGSHVTRG
jgi:hypothetical protein